jgi:hypothetical protein
MRCKAQNESGCLGQAQNPPDGVSCTHPHCTRPSTKAFRQQTYAAVRSKMQSASRRHLNTGAHAKSTQPPQSVLCQWKRFERLLITSCDDAHSTETGFDTNQSLKKGSTGNHSASNTASLPQTYVEVAQGHGSAVQQMGEPWTAQTMQAAPLRKVAGFVQLSMACHALTQ